MELEKQTKQLLDQMTLCPGASADLIAALEIFAGTPLPDQYKAFLAYTDGAEGPIGENSYLALYPVEDVIRLHQSSALPEEMPGFIGIGGSGGNVLYGIDTRCGVPEEMPFIETDMIGGCTWKAVFYECMSFYELIHHTAT